MAINFGKECDNHFYFHINVLIPVDWYENLNLQQR